MAEKRGRINLYDLTWGNAVLQAVKVGAVTAPFVFLSLADRNYFKEMVRAFRSDDDDDNPLSDQNIDLMPTRLIHDKPTGGDMFVIESLFALTASLLIWWLISRQRRRVENYGV